MGEKNSYHSRSSTNSTISGSGAGAPATAALSTLPRPQHQRMISWGTDVKDRHPSASIDDHANQQQRQRHHHHHHHQQHIKTTDSSGSHISNPEDYNSSLEGEEYEENSNTSNHLQHQEQQQQHQQQRRHHPSQHRRYPSALRSNHAANVAGAGSYHVPRSVRNLRLEDVLQTHPLETEAETHVLAAIEARDPVHYRKPSQSNSWTSILRNVPMGAEDAFRGMTTETGTMSRPTTSDDDDYDDNLSSPNRARNDSGQPSMDENTTTGSATTGMGLPQSQQQQQQQQQRRAAQLRLHRRQQTMEQRLDGLTDVLEAIHGHNVATEEDYCLKDLIIPEASEIPAAGGGSVDNMNQFASVLFQRRKLTEVFSEGISNAAGSGGAGNGGGSAGVDNTMQRWQKIRNAHLSAVYSQHDSSGASTRNSSSDEDEHGDLEFDNNDKPFDMEEGGVNVGAVADADGSNNYVDPNKSLRAKKKKSKKSLFQKTCEKIPIVRDFYAFMAANKRILSVYMMMAFWILLPAGSLAFILFYLAGNPPTGRVDREASALNRTLVNQEGKPIGANDVSASWWLLFLCVRQLLTYTLSQATQFFIIDFFCIGRQWTTQYLGPVATLLIVQSKGWPFVLFWWSVDTQVCIPLALLDTNCGGITNNPLYYRLLVIAMSVGFIVALKRTWIGFFLGRKTYVNYAEDLAKVMKKIILLSKVATLAKEIEKDFILVSEQRKKPPCSTRASVIGVARETMNSLVKDVKYEETDGEDSMWGDHTATIESSPYVIDPDEKNRLTGALTDAQRLKINRVLGDWEEPEKAIGIEEDVSVRAILKFRQSLTFLDTPFTFSYPFGLVDTRERCIESAQEVYMRLLLDDPEADILSFDVIATLALRDDGIFHDEILKDLISLLRPDREGKLSLVDFVKSVDAVYKQARLLRAAVRNSQKIDRAFELIFNIVFYVIMACVILSQLGFDPFALFLSLSSIILAFAFMIGSASAKYFEGLLFILVQRPYDIGDRINIEQPSDAGKIEGSAIWVVQDVTLFTTTLLLVTTNEKATVSNGSLASCRIINGARSPHGIMFVWLKFGTEVPYDKIEIFREAVLQFVKARPREWMSMLAFRANDIQAEQGYIKYLVILQHRQAWQDIGAIFESKAVFQSYCLELSRKLDIRYQSPPMPVHMTLEKDRRYTSSGATATSGTTTTPYDGDDILESKTASGLRPNPEDFQKLIGRFAPK